MFKNKKPVVAIDGTSSSGKGTLAKSIAIATDFDHLDTGSLYRYLAHLSVVKKQNIEEIISKNPQINLPDLCKLDLRKESISKKSSIIAQKKIVRNFLIKFQREFANNPPKGFGSIIDGRDISSRIIPCAEIKFFVDANIQTRTNRRINEIKKNKTSKPVFQEIYNQLLERDKRDKERIESPLVRTQDSIYIDTSDLKPDAVLEIALSKFQSIFPNMPIKHCT